MSEAEEVADKVAELKAWSEDYFAEKRRGDDPENEFINLVRGYRQGDGKQVWFCKLRRDGLTVEDYDFSKRAALRCARRAWKKAKDKRWFEQHGYPRTIK